MWNLSRVDNDRRSVVYTIFAYFLKNVMILSEIK